MILSVKNLSKSYGGNHVLNDVSFNADSGEVIAVIGDNGAGKSTLMKAVTGAIVPDAGSVAINNNLLSMNSPFISKSHGLDMIYQDLGLCKQQTVLENLFLGREIEYMIFGKKIPILNKGAMRKTAKSIFDAIGLNIPLDADAQTLSGGQQQAVAIARAMLTDPKILIMDEPTAALGPKEVARILDLIKRMQKAGITIVMICHNLADVLKVSTRILIMQQGKIIKDSPRKGWTAAKLQKAMAV